MEDGGRRETKLKKILRNFQEYELFDQENSQEISKNIMSMEYGLNLHWIDLSEYESILLEEQMD